ncbi:hypothetical protein [Chondromyces crocatus]|uniref:Uncharacterized protein n=1 Tax=Chondromyces crocatus TaxID=52 RepID=A0A0K1EPF8_CHOCO|nr:hypothetical protein [Chondromyces crocatus]AKT42694.1 uncharacterized protein CMC5_069210 [Chondromyces crocatus]
MFRTRFRHARLTWWTAAPLLVTSLLSLGGCAERPTASSVAVDEQRLIDFPGAIHVSTELALGTPSSGPAAGLQDRPAIAWNGDHYLLVWQDNRRGTIDLWATRVEADGTLTDPTGKLLIEDARNATVASDGTDFLVVYGRSITLAGSSDIDWVNLSVEVARVSASGVVLSETTIDGARAYHDHPASVAFDGANYVIAWPTIANWVERPVYHARVSPQGVVLGAGPVASATGYAAAVAFDGVNTLLVAGDAHQITARRIDPQGNFVDATPFPLSEINDDPDPPFYFYQVGVGCSGGLCTAIWGKDGIYETPPFPPSITASSIEARRITSQGKFVDASPLVLWQGDSILGAPQDLSVGFDGEDTLIVWESRQEADGDTAPTSIFTGRLTPQGTLSGVVQLADRVTIPGYHNALASGGPKPLVVWADQRDGYGMWTRKDVTGVFLGPSGPVGAPLLVTGAPEQRHPSVAFDGENFIVAWADGRAGQSGTALDIYAARVSPSAQVLDPQGILVSSAPLFFPTLWDAHPRVAFDGEKAVIGWLTCTSSMVYHECYRVASRFSRAGVPLDATPLNMKMEFQWPGSYHAPGMISGDGEVLVVDPDALAMTRIDQAGNMTFDFTPPDWTPYLEATSLPIASASDGASHLVVRVLPSGVEGARLALDGTPLDGGAWFPISPPGSAPVGATVAFDGVNHVAFWLDRAGLAPRLLATRITPDGTLVDTPPVVVAEHPGCDAVELDAQGAVHSGHRTLVAWKACGPNGSDLFGAALDGDLDVTPFNITNDAHPEHAPALAASGTTILATYSSFRKDAPLGAERLYGRVLTDVPPISVGCSMQGGIPAGSAAPLLGLGLLALLGVKRRRPR